VLICDRATNFITINFFNPLLYRISVCIGILFGITNHTLGQHTLDSLDLDQNVSTWFDKQLGIDHTYLVTGTHKKILVNRNSHPFFEERNAVKGTLAYKGEVFYGVDMLYSTSEDYVVITHPTNVKIFSQPICLDQLGVNWFEINESKFKNYSNQPNREGYYEILVDGEVFSLVSKRSKIKETNSSTRSVEFVLRDSYHLFIGDQTYSGNRKASFTKAFQLTSNE